MQKRAALIFLLLGFSVSLWAQGLPRAIASYYEDWNYVVHNSTEHQRAVLWSAYRRHKTTLLSGTEQELLVRMNRIVDATNPQHHSMPMLLAGTASPVASEILVPSDRLEVDREHLFVQVQVTQLLARATEAGRELPSQSLGGRLLRMCQYTDEWKQSGGQWKVLRSPMVWVTSD